MRLTGSAESGTQVDGRLQGASGLSPRSSQSQAKPAQGARAGSDERQSSSRSALRPRLDGPGAAQGVASLPEDTEVLDAEWTMTTQPDATVLIKHKGAEVVRAQHITWAEKTKESPSGQWVMSKFKADVRNGQVLLTGAITGLDLKAEGTIRRLADNELRLDYDFRVGKAHDGIYGLTLDWRFNFNSLSFEGKVSPPSFWTTRPGGCGQSARTR